MDTTNRVAIDEEKAYTTLLRQIKKSGKQYSQIITVGRGGLSLAQKLSYALDIKEVYKIQSYDLGYQGNNQLVACGERKPDILFVDDIVCTGKTISMIPRGIDVATLVHRKSSLHNPTFTGLVYEGNEYVKFSWEV